VTGLVAVAPADVVDGVVVVTTTVEAVAGLVAATVHVKLGPVVAGAADVVIGLVASVDVDVILVAMTPLIAAAAVVGEVLFLLWLLMF
jgi:hypothetical protein